MDRNEIRYHNKSDKPDNIVKKENEIIEMCMAIESELPAFMKSFFVYLKTGVLPMSRLAYLRDIRFFCRYLIAETAITSAADTRNITASEFDSITAKDINLFIGDYCTRYYVENKHTKAKTVFMNKNRSLARKKSALSVLFKFLYRDKIISSNITDAFNPIRLPKPGEKEIKTLEEDEVKRMLDAAASGANMTKKEYEFWRRTQKRDMAILMLFVTYGLRLSELQQLNISSFNFQRGEFMIFRKRGKESAMPLNKSVEKTLRDYIENERPAEEKIAKDSKDALFLSLQGKRITERAIRQMVKKYASIGMGTTRSAGYSPHKLRATAATALINQGNSIFDVQSLLDHENITTTQLYAAHKKHAKQELIRNFEWMDEFDKYSDAHRVDKNGGDKDEE